MVIQSGRELRFVADRYIAQCKARRTSSQVNELAAELGLSAADLSNLFLKFLRERPHIYLMRARIESAKHLLVTTDLNLDDIAAICGFGTIRSFFRSFRAQVGMTPGEYRDPHRS